MNNIWRSLSVFILKYRQLFLAGVIVLALTMGFLATKFQVASELPKILPKTDSRFQLYESFKKRFGEDGSVMVLGVETDKMFQLNFFQKWQDLSKEVAAVKGIEKVVYAGNVFRIIKND